MPEFGVDFEWGHQLWNPDRNFSYRREVVREVLTHDRPPQIFVMLTHNECMYHKVIIWLNTMTKIHKFSAKKPCMK